MIRAITNRIDDLRLSSVGTKMNMKSIRDEIQGYLHSGLFTNHTRSDRLGELMDALQKKEADLEKRLDAAGDSLQRRHLKIELKVTRMQLT